MLSPWQRVLEVSRLRRKKLSEVYFYELFGSLDITSEWPRGMSRGNVHSFNPSYTDEDRRRYILHAMYLDYQAWFDNIGVVELLTPGTLRALKAIKAAKKFVRDSSQPQKQRASRAKKVKKESVREDGGKAGKQKVHARRV